jgi:hypothetical protein
MATAYHQNHRRADVRILEQISQLSQHGDSHQFHAQDVSHGTSVDFIDQNISNIEYGN